jgi:hypothetical protein
VARAYHHTTSLASGDRLCHTYSMGSVLLKRPVIGGKMVSPDFPASLSLNGKGPEMEVPGVRRSGRLPVIEMVGRRIR